MSFLSLHGLASAFLLLASGSAWSAYPDHAIRVVVPWPAGGSSDLIGRVFAEGLSKQLGVGVVVENRPGANGVIGMSVVQRAAPDGYTLVGTVSEPLTINPAIMRTVPYDVATQFEPLGLIARTSFVMVASSSFPAGDVQGTIALARQRPGVLTVGSYGIADMFLASFEYETGTRFLRVPYQGAAPAITATIASQVDLTMVASSTAQPVTDSLKLIAVGSAQRLPMFPQLRTFGEQGMPSFQIGNWAAVLAPSGLPAEVRAVLVPAIERVVASEEFRARLANGGIEAEHLAPESLARMIQEDAARWRNVVRGMNVPVQ
ncbi:tripartite tricarboxylate transporter substrate binding protein [Belnapia sp. T6]|uniref:Tripartite tricarboxylate transporter substrate binding protein n=1 Tax=Belnapia mucosa TaxID=2804532 RepID=A0ABS1VAW3_9PROT|nr:tripartite tricarboxylate transporter substrate binding protein [Belnapia mucosa]MBL6458814.1 tripartite tricarboxylate transporter substrate binding protein [Belnapia mucosa]